MNLWTFVCIVAVAGIIGECYKHKVSKEKSSEKGSRMDSIEQKLKAIEHRISDLETIIIDREKERKYDKL
jgi:hypothetical protein